MMKQQQSKQEQKLHNSLAPPSPHFLWNKAGLPGAVSAIAVRPNPAGVGSLAPVSRKKPHTTELPYSQQKRKGVTKSHRPYFHAAAPRSATALFLTSTQFNERCGSSMAE